jgi:Leucine-rich repeat (LRR) protein
MTKNLAISCLGLAFIGCSASSPTAPSSTKKGDTSNEQHLSNGQTKALEQLGLISGIKIQTKSEEVTGIDFRNCEAGWSKHLQLALKFPKLESVSVSGDEANDDVMASLSALTNLKSMAFEKSAVTNIGLEALKKHSKLRSLKLACPAVTDDGLRHLADMTELVVLSLQQCMVTDQGFESLSKLTKLKEVVVFKSEVSVGPLKAFSKAPDLNKLSLRGTSLTSQDLIAHIAAFRSLQDLEVSETAIDDVALPTIAKLPKLKALNVWRTKVTDQGLESLVPMGLTRLNLDDNPAIGDEGMEQVAKMTTLEWLHVGKTKITDAGLAKLETLSKLTELRINDTLVSEEALSQFKQKIPVLKTVVH